MRTGPPIHGTAAGGGSSSIPAYFPCLFSPNRLETLVSIPRRSRGEQQGRGRWGALTFNSDEDFRIYTEVEFKNSCPAANQLQLGTATAGECWSVPGMGRIYTPGIPDFGKGSVPSLGTWDRFLSPLHILFSQLGHYGVGIYPLVSAPGKSVPACWGMC